MWRRSWGGGRLAPVGWPLFALFVGLPLWWLLGASAFIGPLLALPLVLPLVGHREVQAPRGFGLWLLFLLWVFVTATQVVEPRDWAAFSYRALGYLAATVVFLYVLNVPRELLPTRTIVKGLAAFWVIVAAGGMVGVFVPAFSFSTPTEVLLPASLVQDPFVYDMVHASTSSAKAFAAYPIYRPKAPLPYTNMWGSVYALTLPFAFAALTMARARWRKLALISLIAISLVPLVFSLSRAAWLSIGVAGVYAVFRLASGGKGKALLGALVVVLLAGGLVVFTPLGEIMQVRFGAGYSNEGRLNLYSESLRLAQASPIFGHGAPVDIPGSPSAGTHGQLWTVLVSNGIPGTALFLGGLLWMAWHSGRDLWSGGRRRITVRFWTHLVIVIALVQLPFYALLPWGLVIVMVAAALFWREVLLQRASATPPVPSSIRVTTGARKAEEPASPGPTPIASPDVRGTAELRAIDARERRVGTAIAITTSAAPSLHVVSVPSFSEVSIRPWAGEAGTAPIPPGRPFPLGGRGWFWLSGIVAITAGVVFFSTRPSREPATQDPVRATTEPGLATPVESPASEAAVMPDLRGRTFAEALAQLEDLDLVLKETVVAEGEPGVVVATDPSLGRLVRPGTSVTLYVGA